MSTMVYCKYCNRVYNSDLFELEDGYYYCHVCNQPIQIEQATQEEIDNDEDEDLKY